MPSLASDLILARLHALHPKSIDLSLGRVERLLAALDHPERRLPPVIHIAGTNGKGSTLAMLAAMLRAAGRRVDRYISPHLVRFNERILLDGEPIAEDRLAACLARCEAANGGAPITFFEITTAAAFLAFAESRADWVLLETGLGGRLDATNVVPRPRLTLLAPVSMDHESYLGDTLAMIAAEKAGILKPGVPAVVGPQQPDALGRDHRAGSRARCAAARARARLAGGADAGGDAGRARGPAGRAAAAGAARHASDHQCRSRRGGGTGARRGGTGRRGHRPRPRRGALAGPAATARRRAGRWRRSRPACRSGSTAATTPPPARRSPRACRPSSTVARSISWSACCRPRISTASSTRSCRWRRACASCRCRASRSAAIPRTRRRPHAGGVPGRSRPARCRMPWRPSPPRRCRPTTCSICGSLYLAGEVLREHR